MDLIALQCSNNGPSSNFCSECNRFWAFDAAKNSETGAQLQQVFAAPKNSKLQLQFIDHLKRPTNPSSTSISFFPQATFHYKTLAARTSHPWPRAPATGNNNPHFAKTALKPNYMHQVVNTFGEENIWTFAIFNPAGNFCQKTFQLLGNSDYIVEQGDGEEGILNLPRYAVEVKNWNKERLFYTSQDLGNSDIVEISKILLFFKKGSRNPLKGFCIWSLPLISENPNAPTNY